MIGIIGAMDEEVAQIVEVMQVEREESKACMTFKAGKLNGKDVVVVRSGIGKVNAAVCTQILVDDFNVDYVFRACTIRLLNLRPLHLNIIKDNIQERII